MPSETDVKISVSGNGAQLRNLVTGEVLAAQPQPQGARGRPAAGDPQTTFNVHLLPHSYAVFGVEK